MTSEHTTQLDRIVHHSLDMLARWLPASEEYWYAIPGHEDTMGCYGTGYNWWGVQTLQKYIGAMGALAVLGQQDDSISDALCDLALERALAALRYNLASHITGSMPCLDNVPWGHYWLSALGIERMMYGVQLLMPYLTEQDQADLERVIVSEADWALRQYTRGQYHDVVAGLWNSDGKNGPESNMWEGTLLWRAAQMYPYQTHADEWIEQAHRFLVNAISVPADETNQDMVGGKPVRERFVGANFFPNYALDHHGYFNMGYSVITLSNAAMLHFDMQSAGFEVPDSLYHHSANLWDTIRRMIFADGRLARIGGDSRIRYCYCQDYLLPSLIYAADCLNDDLALNLAEEQLDWVQHEAAYNEDGSFLDQRLAPLIDYSPYYYTRLEGDRADALGMAAAFAHTLRARGTAVDESLDREERLRRWEASVAGSWCEPEHGAVIHRSPTRLASFSWRAFGLGQGMCLPPTDGHLAEWAYNLAGYVRFLGDDGKVPGGQTQHRRLLDQHITTFEGGFVTIGAIMEGVDIELAEGWRGTDSAEHQICFAALPDDHTVVGLEFCQAGPRRCYTAEVKGMHLNIPNDLYNGFERNLTAESGELTLGRPESDLVLDLNSSWVNIDGVLGASVIDGAEGLVVSRSANRRGGKYNSLHVEEICCPCVNETIAWDANSVLIDAAWLAISSVDATQTRAVSQNTSSGSEGTIRWARVTGHDGFDYVVAANWGFAAVLSLTSLNMLLEESEQLEHLATGEMGRTLHLPRRSAAVYRVIA